MVRWRPGPPLRSHSATATYFTVWKLFNTPDVTMDLKNEYPYNKYDDAKAPRSLDSTK